MLLSLGKSRGLLCGQETQPIVLDCDLIGGVVEVRYGAVPARCFIGLLR